MSSFNTFTCKALFLFILFFSSSLIAKNFKLNPKYLKPQKNPIAVAIFQDYERFMNKISHKSLHVKIEAINHYINTITSIDDSPHDAMLDIWSTRAEFLAKGGGDCEDYAITKYYSLKDMKIDPKKMCLIVVNEKYSGFDHMVLGLWQDKKSPPLILDNLSFKVLPLNKRVDLIPSYCINEDGYFTIDKNGNRKKANIQFKAYESMLKRMKQERLWK